jgi:hypothetical protein
MTRSVVSVAVVTAVLTGVAFAGQIWADDFCALNTTLWQVYGDGFCMLRYPMLTSFSSAMVTTYTTPTCYARLQCVEANTTCAYSSVTAPWTGAFISTNPSALAYLGFGRYVATAAAVIPWNGMAHATVGYFSVVSKDPTANDAQLANIVIYVFSGEMKYFGVGMNGEKTGSLNKWCRYPADVDPSASIDYVIDWQRDDTVFSLVANGKSYTYRSGIAYADAKPSFPAEVQFDLRGLDLQRSRLGANFFWNIQNVAVYDTGANLPETALQCQ